MVTLLVYLSTLSEVLCFFPNNMNRNLLSISSKSAQVLSQELIHDRPGHMPSVTQKCLEQRHGSGHLLRVHRSRHIAERSPYIACKSAAKTYV